MFKCFRTIYGGHVSNLVLVYFSIFLGFLAILIVFRLLQDRVEQRPRYTFDELRSLFATSDTVAHEDKALARALHLISNTTHATLLIDPIESVRAQYIQAQVSKGLVDAATIENKMRKPLTITRTNAEIEAVTHGGKHSRTHFTTEELGILQGLMERIKCHAQTIAR